MQYSTSDRPEMKDAHTVDELSFPYIYEQNVAVPLKTASNCIIRCNVYRPKETKNGVRLPVLVTYGPYGKDIHYKDFNAQSYAEVNPEHHSEHSAWETPDPAFWTKNMYIIVRADESGSGQSPGILQTFSRQTTATFFDMVEWASNQPWSSGKVGLLGVSYYAATQWPVAALKPKGLSAIIPWEGASDYYRDCARHGGILSNTFSEFWWHRQVASNQYGLPGRKERNWGPDTVEGDLTEKELQNNRHDQPIDNARHRFRNEEYYANMSYNMGDIEVPLLSVGNWGGNSLHLRGNLEGYTHAGSEFKYLRMITGRHDLPFYQTEEVEIQLSFLNAFLKDDDPKGWTRKGTVAPVDIVLRRGDVGFNDAEKEKIYERRTENEWPIARTQYTRFYLTPSQSFTQVQPIIHHSQKLSYEALGSLENPNLLQFTTLPFEEETEVTGYIVAHLNVSVSPHANGPTSSDIDIFLTLRHISPEGKEVHYTGTVGDPVPLAKGWLRASLRKVDLTHPKHRECLPWRNYFNTEVEPVVPGEVYGLDVEVWPTTVVVERGGKIIFEVSSGDTQGCGIFHHNHPEDRSDSTFAGLNHLHFGEKCVNYVTLPIIPPK